MGPPKKKSASAPAPVPPRRSMRNAPSNTGQPQPEPAGQPAAAEEPPDIGNGAPSGDTRPPADATSPEGPPAEPTQSDPQVRSESEHAQAGSHSSPRVPSDSDSIPRATDPGATLLSEIMALVDGADDRYRMMRAKLDSILERQDDRF